MTTQDHQTVPSSAEETFNPPPETTPVNEAPSPESQQQPAEQGAQAATRTQGTTSEGEAVADESWVEHQPTEEILFGDDQLAELRTRWAGVQSAFVDDPKECVQKADDLVSDLVEQLTTGFAQARSHLEEQWARGEDASTEDLRVALMHYREFFERLLAV